MPDLTDVQKAMRRAQLANQEETQRLAEMEERTKRSRHQKDVNHFAPLILRAMGDKK